MARAGSGVSQQHKASFRRWEDAEALRGAARWQGAMYMAGYAIECALKATLMHEWKVRTLAELETRLREDHGFQGSLFTHDLELLFGLTRVGRSVLANPEPAPDERQFARWFRACNSWTVSWRYTGSQGRREDCERMLSAADVVIRRVRGSN